MASDYKTECIFVIHSEKDNHIIDALTVFFEPIFYHDKNNDVFTKFKITYLDSNTGDYVGENFGNIIKEKITNCSYYLIVLTKNSVSSLWVNQEIGYSMATNEDKILIMREDQLRGGSFGFIHTNYHVQEFSSKNFSIKENGEEIKKIHKKIRTKYGPSIRIAHVMKESHEFADRYDSMEEYAVEVEK